MIRSNQQVHEMSDEIRNEFIIIIIQIIVHLQRVTHKKVVESILHII